MAIIVQHKKNLEKYILLGSGLGMYQSKKPNWIFGDLVADTDSGIEPCIFVCDEEGDILWGSSSDFIVIRVDGKPFNQIL